MSTLIYSRRIQTEDKLYIGAFAQENYVSPTATQPNTTKGNVRIFIARNSVMTQLSRSPLFPRKELRAIYLDRFMNWAVEEDFYDKSINEILNRLRIGHDNAHMIGSLHF